MRTYKKMLVIILMIISTIFIASCGSNTKEKETNNIEMSKLNNIESEEVVNSERKILVVPENGVPVLMYHMVGEIENNDAVIKESLFREQMKYLIDNGYNTISLDELYGYVTKGQPLPEKPVVLTFDDGYKDTYTIVYPLLTDYKMKATVFINPGDIGQRLTWREVKEMHDGGMTIASHTYLHSPMDATMTADGKYQNIKLAQDKIKEVLNIDNKYICYPYGIYDEEVMQMANNQGIKLGMAMDHGWAHYGDNPLEIKRVWIGNRIDIDKFQERLKQE